MIPSDDWFVMHKNCLAEDGLQSFPAKTFDHVITDPPYEKEAHQKIVRINSKGPGHGKSFPVPAVQHSFLSLTDDARIAYAREMVRVSKGWVVVFCQLEAFGLWHDALIAAGAKWRRACVWHKPDAMPQITGDRPGQGCEGIAVAWAGKGKSRWNWRGKQGTFVVRKFEKGRVHTAQKPVALMAQIVEAFTQPGDRVCDPFCGAGTTGVACVRLGRRFVGIDSDQKCFNATVGRLKRESNK